jgi:hypothetical protein
LTVKVISALALAVPVKVSLEVTPSFDDDPVSFRSFAEILAISHHFLQRPITRDRWSRRRNAVQLLSALPGSAVTVLRGEREQSSIGLPAVQLHSLLQ